MVKYSWSYSLNEVCDTKEFATRIKEVHKKVEVVLRKSQEEIRKYADRKRSELKEYKVGDWVLLSIKDLKY